MEDWPVFLCYRQVDGKPTAEWLYKQLHNERIPTEDNDGPRLEIYFDETAPPVGNWRDVHQPALERARAMLVVCTPGLHSRFQGDDWVHRELDWWLDHRRTAPILIDTTGEGDRWVPETIQRRWPKAQRIEFKLAEWEHGEDEARSATAQRIVSRIIDGIRRSEAQTTYEDLERFKRLARRLRIALIFAAVALAGVAISAAVALQQRAKAIQARDQKQVVVDFQSSMLGDVDAELMGIRLKKDLGERLRESLEKKLLHNEQVQSALASFEESLRSINATDAALKILDENVLSRAVETIEKDFADQPLVRAALQQTVADTYEEIGLYEPAMPLQEAALETRRQELGDDHPDTLTSINNMGYLLESMGKLAEAEPYCREALETKRRVLGDDHPSTLTSINNMGGLLESMGKLAEAEPYYREALETKRRVLGDDHPSTLTSINDMGVLLELMGKYDEAMPYYREDLEGSRRVLGDDHPDTLTSINNMGGLLESMGKLGEAEPYYREALEGSRRALGDDHPDTLISINNVGYLLESMGKPAEAEPYYREALKGSRRVLGDDHPDTLLSISNMGALLQSMGKLAEGEPYYREALEASRRVLGDDHPGTLTSINNMGFLLQSMGRLSEAEPYYRQALEACRRVLGDDNPDTLISIHNMGRLLRDLGRLEEAEALGGEAVERARRSLTGSHWLTGVYLSSYGMTLLKLERYADTEVAVVEAHEILEAALGSEHERVIKVIQSLADLYTAWHEAEPDQGYDAQAAAWRAKLPTAERADSLIKLGMRLLEDGRHAEAEAPLGESLQIRQDALPEGHWLIFNTMSVLGESLAGQAADRSLTVAARIEKLREAEPLLLEGYEGMQDDAEAADERKREALERIVKLYEAWHGAEPDQGYDVKAAEWRSKLPDNDPK